jgi:aminoglycoside phosphotransferase (APT) family kinase protein
VDASLVDEVRAEASAAWPELDWSSAVLKQGAFHDVLVGEHVVARISRSRFAATLMPSRVEVLARLRGAAGDLAVPEVMSEVHFWSDVRVGCLLSRLPGFERDLGDAIPPSAMARVLASIRALDPSWFASQRVRNFCGGSQFPELVERVISPSLPAELRTVASAVVRDLLDAEAGCPTGPIHGDLTPFNIMWNGDDPVGVLDWDFCALGDVALDIAGILTTLGRGVAEPVCDASTLERAALHRATFPLQIACAGHLHDDRRLVASGVNNFVARHRAGSLYWPSTSA